jgi:tetratricopeptide (TPR) repeat protein
MEPERGPSEIFRKIETATRLKEEGNQLFREERYSKAKSKYGMALAYITGFPGSKRSQTGYETLANQAIRSVLATDDEEAAAAELELILQQNLAACYLKIGDPQAAITHCNKALALNANAWKAKLRKGEAYTMKESFSEAKSILEDALNSTAEPAAIAAIKSAMKRREIEMKKAKIEENKRLKAMFGAKNETGASSSASERAGTETEAAAKGTE